MNSEKLEKCYEKVSQKHPEIKDERHLELLTRKYIFSKKMKSVGIMFLMSFVLILIFGLYPDPLFEKGIDNLIQGLTLCASSVLGIISVLKLARTLHDPLTPDEAKELREKEMHEKTGH